MYMQNIEQFRAVGMKEKMDQSSESNEWPARLFGNAIGSAF